MIIAIPAGSAYEVLVNKSAGLPQFYCFIMQPFWAVLAEYL
jgi:hypothetical protein